MGTARDAARASWSRCAERASSFPVPIPAGMHSGAQSSGSSRRLFKEAERLKPPSGPQSGRTGPFKQPGPVRPRPCGSSSSSAHTLVTPGYTAACWAVRRNREPAARGAGSVLTSLTPSAYSWRLPRPQEAGVAIIPHLRTGKLRRGGRRGLAAYGAVLGFGDRLCGPSVQARGHPSSLASKRPCSWALLQTGLPRALCSCRQAG